ncbi:MAG TPA: hypothetical protein VJ377_05715, partial [Dehalococcoidales bacterium]|nr:hypothetical protein [Dehalococcoidales bacterium]
SHKAAEVRAFVAFATVENILALYSINLSITPNIPGTESLPSMLGTDVLHRWHIVWDSSLDILDCEIITYDAIMPEELS